LTSLRFNGHFPGEPGLANFIEAKDGGSGGENWSLSPAKLQSNHHHQQTNTQARKFSSHLASCFITMQNLLVVSHTERTHEGSPWNFLTAEGSKN